jgi:hypothetical protein
MAVWIRHRRIGWVVAGLALCLSAEWRPGAGLAKELPLPATVQELSAQPDQYDGHRVFVTGRVRTIKIEIGRRGSEFVAITLEDLPPDGTEGPTVKVFSATAPQIGRGSRISVQGTYHRQGRFGGLPHEEFIEADAIVKEH